MTNVAHSALTGSNLHEPKGVATATLGQVYVADGFGSGAWTSIAATAFTGMIADFTLPSVPTGWLELNGADVSATTYEALYNVMTIQQSGTRVSGNAVISGLTSTADMRAGYFVFGTGIASGTTIVSVDSSIQITLSGNASTSGTSTVVVSPWLLNTGTLRLPDTTTSGRYRRSRTGTGSTSSTRIGALLADQNTAHTHTGTTSSDGSHTHTVTDPTHSHTNRLDPLISGGSQSFFPPQTSGIGTGLWPSLNTYGSAAGSQNDLPVATGISLVANGAHTHTISSDGSAEARPLTMVVMTCVKT